MSAYMREIVAEVARARNTTVVDIMGDSRFREHVDARHEAMRVIRARMPWMSLPMIGRFFGRTHATVHYAIHRRRR